MTVRVNAYDGATRCARVAAPMKRRPEADRIGRL
jgi:hypothetical protein